MRRAVLVFLAIVAMVAPIGLAQVGGTQAGSPQAPAQAQQAAPPKSTALVLGQVVDGSTGQPIADAVVTLSQMGGRGANPMGVLPAGASPQAQQAMQTAAAVAAAAGRGGPSGPQRVMTGADGRFVFHDLPPGTFQVTASLIGYTASLGAGSGGGSGGITGLAGILAAASTPQGSPTTLVLKEGEFATSVKMRLWKQAVVSGTVLDDAGEPAIGVSVTVARRVMVAGRARYVPGSSAKTDDRGVYRISGLVPASYLVVVPQTQVSIPTAVFSGLIESLTGGGPGGGGWAMLDMLSSGIDMSTATSGGVRIGDYMVASSGSVPLLGPDGRLQAFQTAFYPNATAPAQASVISLASGEERADLNFQLRLIPTSRVSGLATGPDGPVANLGIKLLVPGGGGISESEIDVASTMSKADGTFAFHGVPPGQFLLRAVKQPRPALPMELMSDPTLQAMFGSGGTKGTTETLFATETVAVSASDVDGIALQLAPGFRVSGRLEFESTSGRQPPAGGLLQGIVIALMSAEGGSPAGLFGDRLSPDRANAQGEFKTKGYPPGKHVISVTAPPGWQVKSAAIGGRDVLDAPLEITNGDVSGIVVTLTDRMAQLSGTVSAPGETDLSEVTVLLFPAGYRAWVANGMSARLARTTRASRAGAYSIANVPAGEYLVAAIDRANEGDLQDPAFIEALSRIATRVTIGADPATLDLTRARVVVR